MPRPKVLPQNRQRAVQACRQCRTSKKRCDGKQPCAHCIRKGLARSCVFADASLTSTQSATHPQSMSSPGSSRDVEAANSINDTSRMQESHGNPSFGAASSTHTTSPQALHRTHPRLLDSGHGDKVFVGGSASLAFLQLIRDVVSQSLGNSGFSHPSERDNMLESPRHNLVSTTEIALGQTQEHEFIDLAFTATQGLIEFWKKDCVVATLHRRARPSSERDQLQMAIAQTVIAIGAQCAAKTDANSMVDQSYFAEAQRRAFGGMLQDSRIETVQLFLLMTFYMFGACQRNAGYVYLGIAARAAYVLGLHYDGDDARSEKSYTAVDRVLTWKSLVTLDIITSAILGRPSATSTQHNHYTIDRRISDDKENSAIHANYMLACLLDQKVQKLYSADKVTVEGARVCLDLLNKWSGALPSELRQAPSSISDVGALDRIIGGLHVSCCYYFGVMLVSRPFLVVHLTNRLTLSHSEPRDFATDMNESNSLAEIQEIAVACLNAAMYMIQTCSELQDRGILPDNMRILKAWVFAAGLVLGFDMFTVKNSDPEIEEAFRGSCKVLQMLSDKSAQAAHYFDILESLSDAIATRRQQTLSRNSRARKPIVERIMAFGPQQLQPGAESTAPETLVEPALSASAGFDGSTDMTWPADAAIDLDFETLMNDPFLNWSSTDFLSWS